MSINRASGAIPTITALQTATASLAAPKSVMNTIVGRAPTPACPNVPLPAGDFLHAQQKKVPARNKITKNRVRKAIESPKLNVRCKAKSPRKSRGPSMPCQLFRFRRSIQERGNHCLPLSPSCGISPSTIISFGFNLASITISGLRKRSYARTSSLPRPEKAQPHCVREFNRDLNKEENDCASKFIFRCVFVPLRNLCTSRSGHAEKWRPPVWNHRQVR